MRLIIRTWVLDTHRGRSTHFQTVNIANAYEDSRFDQSVDEGAGFKHSTVLCMPIKNSSGQIIGVIQVIIVFFKLFCT